MAVQGNHGGFKYELFRQFMSTYGGKSLREIGNGYKIFILRGNNNKPTI